MHGKTKKSDNEPSRSSIGRRIVAWLVTLLLGVVVAFAAFVIIDWLVLYATDNDAVQFQSTQQQTAIPSEEPVREITIQGRYLFSGTIVLARGIEHYAVTNGDRDYAQPFSKLPTLEHTLYDAWLADLECPVTDDLLTYEYQISATVFNCNPAFLPEFVKFFEFVNLANNHTSDAGADGFATTQEKLNEAGIQHVGSYDPSSLSDICEVVGLPVRGTTDGVEEERRWPVALCAWNYFLDTPGPGELEVMSEYAEVMPVFALQHSGVEYVATASDNQSSLARTLIDLGAEFVIGNSPHWVQNTEVHNGKLIAYSTGNFIFDQLDDETNRGASFDLTIDVVYDENIERWLALGDSCVVDNDDCLARAEAQGLTKPELQMTWDIVASVGGFRELTQKAPTDVQTAVEERANWQRTLGELRPQE